jgi:hypothetical protein
MINLWFFVSCSYWSTKGGPPFRTREEALQAAAVLQLRAARRAIDWFQEDVKDSAQLLEIGCKLHPLGVGYHVIGQPSPLPASPLSYPQISMCELVANWKRYRKMMPDGF